MRALRWRHRAAEVGLVAARHVGSLLRNCNEVEVVFSLESGALAELLAGDRASRSPFITWLRNCGFAQCWMQDQDGTLRAALAVHGVLKVGISSPMSDRWKSRHQTDRFLEAAQCLGLQVDADRPLRTTDGMEERGHAALVGAGVPRNSSYVVIHPGSGSIHKCCHAALLASLLDWVWSKGLLPVIVQGPADEEQVRNLTAQPSRSFYLLKENDLSILAGIIKNAVLHVGHDSGLTHLAASLGVPTVACFGPTDEGRWGPRGRWVALVRGNPCLCPTWEAVQQCRDKCCLKISSSSLLHACERMLEFSQPKA
jgi:hypothetical protein